MLCAGAEGLRALELECRGQRERFSCGAYGTCGAPKAKPRSDTILKNDFSHIMLQITCVTLINSLPADIICDSFDLVVVQWNRETQTLWRAKSVLKGTDVLYGHSSR